MPAEQTTSANHGRNPNLITLRNQALIKRFYYLSEIKRKRYDDVLHILSTQEFFISECRIEAILAENSAHLDVIYQSRKINNKLLARVAV